MPKPPRYRPKPTIQRRVITPSTLIKIREKFIQKGWIIEDTHSYSCFQRYCSMISGLIDNQQESLIFELTDRFLTIEDEEYDKYFFYSVKNLFREVSCRNMYIIPMIAPEYIGYSVKSGGRIAYLFKGKKVKTLSEYKGQNIKLYDNIEHIPDSIDINDVIILADDFIGTGDTAQKAIDHLYKVKPKIKDLRIMIISLASLKTGFDLIESMGIPIYTTVILHRGISDYYNSPEKEINLELMAQIETKINVPHSYKLGYKKSEALISLIRTPNNTLPVFWLDNKITQSPFPR